MKSFRILYLEHDSTREAIRQAMEAAGANVTAVGFRDHDSFLAEVEAELKTGRFDLVVSDAYFLPDGQDHLLENMDGEYLLDAIVSKVREIEEHRTRIAVLTAYGSELFSEAMASTLKMVDYLWNKDCTTQTFITWQISRIHEETTRRFPSHLLIESLLGMLEGEAGTQCPWRNEMATMLACYKESRGQLNQVNEVQERLQAIAASCDIDDKVVRLLEMLAEAETVQTAAKPKAWGHLRHVLNVFWLGYYFLNSGWFDSAAIWKKITGQERIGREVLMLEVNLAWLLASLFHDIGLLGERLPALAKNCNRLLERYLVGKWKVEAVALLPESDENVLRLRGELTSAMGKDIAGWFQQAIRHGDGAVDHGLLSGMTILSSFGKEKKLEKIATHAAAAAALHNVSKNAGKNGIPELPEISLAAEPIAALLILCDQIQVWDRETGLESMFADCALECAELSALGLDRGKKEILAAINYFPFREVLPKDKAMDELRKKLKKKLTEEVKPILRRLRGVSDKHPSLRIDFKLDGRWDLDSWELQKAQ